MNASLLEFLGWISRSRRTYSEAMDAWKTHCPRLSIWEDALAAGLVEIRRDDIVGISSVALTEAGRTMLDDAARSRVGARSS